MKKLILLVASFLSLAAFGQGKVSFQNNSLHLAYWPDGPLSNQAINNDNLPAGIPGMVADLYMGTSSGLLYLYSTATFGPLATGPGKWTSLSVIANPNATTGAPGILGGTTAFIEVVVRSTERAAPNIFDRNSANLFLACYFSAEFNFTLGSGITYPVLWGPNGNWPDGTVPMDQYGVGSRGAIPGPIPIGPEPSAVALLGLGAAIFIFGRRSWPENRFHFHLKF